METTPFPDSSHPWLIAHRGANDCAPENTRPAFEEALAHPIDGIECDIQMSADGQLVIYHDPTLFKIIGKRRPVASTSLEELSTMDFGAWMSAEFTGTPLLTLDEVLADYSDRTRLMLEIKSRKSDQTTGRWERLTDAVAAVLQRSRPTASPGDRLFVLSFDPRVLVRMKETVPEMPCVLNLPEAAIEKPRELFASSREVTDGLSAVCIKDRFLTEELVQSVHEQGKRMFTYACNRPGQVNRALVLGVDAIMTDRPGWLTKFLGAS